MEIHEGSSNVRLHTPLTKGSKLHYNSEWRCETAVYQSTSNINKHHTVTGFTLFVRFGGNISPQTAGSNGPTIPPRMTTEWTKTTTRKKPKYSRTPLIRKLVIRTVNYPERLGPSGKQYLTVTVLHLITA